MILADTSIWVDHLRRGSGHLSDLLETGQIVCHPFVIGELACGRLKPREEILGLLSTLPSATQASHEEVLAVVREHRLDGQGLGWIDAHLLASARLAGCRLWSGDKALMRAAKSLGVGV